MENIAKKNMDNQKARISSDLLEMDKPMAGSVDDKVYFYDFLKLHYSWIIAHTLCTKISKYTWVENWCLKGKYILR